MSGSKVGLCTVEHSSEVTMINEDGFIAEMIIEVDDDDNQQEVHEPFNFELDEDDDCIEVYSSGFAPSRSNYLEHNTSQNWMCNREVQFGVKDSNEGKEVTPGVRDLNLHSESAVESPHVPPVASVSNSEEAHDCIVIDNISAKKSRTVESPCVSPIENVTNSEKTRDCIIIDDASAKKPGTVESPCVSPIESVTNSDKTHDCIIIDDASAKKPMTVESPCVPPVESVANSAKMHDCIAVDDTSVKKPKRKYEKKLIHPKSSMVTRRKTAADNICVNVSEEATKDMAVKEGTADVAIETIDAKDITNSVLGHTPNKVTNDEGGDRISFMTDVPEETSNKVLKDKGSEDVSKEASDAPKGTTESITSDLGCKLGSRTAQSGENVLSVSSSEPVSAVATSSELTENSSASKANEVDSINHKTNEDESASERNIPGCGEKLADIPYIQHAIQNTTKRLGLRAFYKLIYGFRIPKDMEMIKERVLQFNGFSFEENSIGFERKMKALKVFPDAARKQMCCILGIDTSSKSDICYEILKFLLKPKCQNNQFTGARYQPLVLLERLPPDVLRYETVEANLIQNVTTPARRESPVRKRKKRKATDENSEVRLTRSAKRLMQHREETDQEVETSIPSTSSNAPEERSRRVKEDKKSHESKVLVKSQSDGRRKTKKSVAEVPLSEHSDSETDECPTTEDGIPPLPESSETESSGSTKGTLGRRLGDFWNIRKNIEKADKESLQTLFTILYDKYDKPENWKKRILRFSGFDFKCVSSKWRRKEFILSLMPPSKLKRIADMLHLQYYNSKSQKPLVLNIMKFLSEPRDGMLKHSNFAQNRRKRRKKFSASRQQDKQGASDEEIAAQEVKALLQDIRKKRRAHLLLDSSDMSGQNSYTESKKKKLGDIPNVQFMIITSNYEDIDNLHQLLFLQSGPRAKVRRNVQNFDGFPFGPGNFNYKIRIKLLTKMGYEVTKRIAFFLGLASLGTTIPQHDLNELIMHFLKCPGDIKCKSIKAYPKNFFNNNPTERPVVDITSITDAVKSKMKIQEKLTKERKHNKEKPEEMETEHETSRLETDLSKTCTKKRIKTEKNDTQNDSSESLVAENIMDTDASTSAGYEERKEKKIDIDKDMGTSMQNQKDCEMSLSVPRTVGKRKYAKRKLNVPATGKGKSTVSKQGNNQPDKDAKSEVDEEHKKQFLFRFDPSNEFDSTKILEYLNRESQKSVSKGDEVLKSEVKKPVQTAVSSVPLKITTKSELPASPKVISILLPPPSQSPQKTFSVISDLNNKTNSGASNADCATSLQSTSTSSSNISSRLEGKFPIPALPKRHVISLTPQSLQTLQLRAPSTHVTRIKVPSNLLEGMKGSQIEGVIRLPQNYAAGQNISHASSSSGTVSSDVLSLPEVQKCLQQISSTNGKNKQVQMIKIPANNSVAFQSGSLNMSGGKVYVIPVKPKSHQGSSLPAASVVTPIQVNNHIVVPSSAESGGTSVNIPQLIQVARNYSRTVGTTGLPVSGVTITKVKPEFVGPVSFPTVSAGQCVFPVNITPNSNLVQLPVVNVQNVSMKEPNQVSEPSFIVKSAEKPKQEQSSNQQKEDNNSDSELDEEPLSHLVGHPSDDMLLQNIREIVIGADLSAITMRNVLQKVFDKYPQFDLTYRKSFLKDAVKKIICSAPPPRTT